MFGYGLGAHYDIGIVTYPHNAFLEMALDGGVILVLAFLPPLVYLLVSVIKGSKLKVIISIGALYILFAQMFSGGYYDMRLFFVSLVALSLSSRINSRNSHFRL